jgi:hypothetical protein
MLKNLVKKKSYKTTHGLLDRIKMSLTKFVMQPTIHVPHMTDDLESVSFDFIIIVFIKNLNQ